MDESVELYDEFARINKKDQAIFETEKVVDVVTAQYHGRDI